MAQLIHVWNSRYLPNCVIFGANVGQDSSAMEQLGDEWDMVHGIYLIGIDLTGITCLVGYL